MSEPPTVPPAKVTEDSPKDTPATTTATTPASTPKKQAPAKKVVRILVPPRSSRPPRVEDTKVRLGKANPWRELGIPAAFIAVGIMFCWGMSDIGTHVTGIPSRVELLMGMSTQRAEQKFNQRGGKSAPNCQLFYAKSTLPGAGYGIFVGNDYEEGDTIVLPGREFLAVPENPWAVSQPAFLLKHHHTLANIDGVTVRETPGKMDGSNDMEFKATRPIRAGEELLLPLQSHPKSWLQPTSKLFQYIPGEKEFKTAEEIVRDMVSKFKWSKGKEARVRQIEETLNLIVKTARRLDPMVARFLPNTKSEMDRWIKDWKDGVPFEAVALTAKSVQGLEMNARCLDYVMEHPQSTTTATITKQKIAKGSVVIPIPLYVQPVVEPQQQICEAETDDCSPTTTTRNDTPCLQTANLPFALCALTLPTWILPVEGTEPNVEYRWGKGDSHNDLSRALSAEQVLEHYTTQLSFELVALRDLEPGEVLRVGSGVEEMIPEQWKKVGSE